MISWTKYKNEKLSVDGYLVTNGNDVALSFYHSGDFYIIDTWCVNCRCPQCSNPKNLILENVTHHFQVPSLPKIKYRTINAPLKLKIFKRDNFKCKNCNKSPATHPECQLQIDHIIPFSKGGLNHFNNLQTLCQRCNYLKGDSIP